MGTQFGAIRQFVHFAVLGSLSMVAPAGVALSETLNWKPADLNEALQAIDSSASEGLDPNSYFRSKLAEAIAHRDAPAAARIADQAIQQLAHDYYEGAAPSSRRTGWHINRGQVDYSRWLAGVEGRSLSASLKALLPTDPQYQSLKNAYAGCTGKETAMCQTLRLNLDRWRWLPRETALRLVRVNVPAFRVDVIENGRVIESHKVIVGKLSTPTPFFVAQLTAVTINPWWTVPNSIAAEMGLTPRQAALQGFAMTPEGMLRQRPSPRNALGRIKFEMPNPYTIYLHDTPAKKLFRQVRRAYSHGCIRVQQPFTLAKRLIDPAQHTMIDALLASGKNQTLPLSAPIPVEVVYFTAEADPSDQTQIIYHNDLYGLDGVAQSNMIAASHKIVHNERHVPKRRDSNAPIDEMPTLNGHLIGP